MAKSCGEILEKTQFFIDGINNGKFTVDEYSDLLDDNGKRFGESVLKLMDSTLENEKLKKLFRQMYEHGFYDEKGSKNEWAPIAEILQNLTIITALKENVSNSQLRKIAKKILPKGIDDYEIDLNIGRMMATAEVEGVNLSGKKISAEMRCGINEQKNLIANCIDESYENCPGCNE